MTSNTAMIPSFTPSMNPSTKGTDHGVEDGVTGEKLLFFNYHEYSVKNYRLIGENTEDFHEQALIITHFPNFHVPRDSNTFEGTRIVRISRYFKGVGVFVPQFSPYLPGTEPAAIFGDDDTNAKFIVQGEYMGQFFGTSSYSPLSEYLTEKEFREIVEEINVQLRDAYNSWSLINLLLFVLDLLSFWIMSDLLHSLSKRVCTALEISHYPTNLCRN